jgi:hypothetical protein
MTESPIYTDAVSRLIGKLFADDCNNDRLQLSKTDQIADSTNVFLCEHREFTNQTGAFANEIMWSEPDKDEFIVSCHWHLSWTVPRSTILGRLACLVLSKILGIGTAERNWKQVKS